MITYLDSSVLLRVVLGQPDRLQEWHDIEVGITSALSEVECLRTLDRLRFRAEAAEFDLTGRREAVYRLLEALAVVELGRAVLGRASQPLPAALGTLDALHLATALLWRETRDPELVLGTHDRSLAEAARATGFRVLGV